MIGERLFSSQQGDPDFEAIRLRRDDGHDYFDQSCIVNADSIEVFFDATNPMLVAYVDALLASRSTPVNESVAPSSGTSLRFTGPTDALVGPEQWGADAVIEVRGRPSTT